MHQKRSINWRQFLLSVNQMQPHPNIEKAIGVFYSNDALSYTIAKALVAEVPYKNTCLAIALERAVNSK